MDNIQQLSLVERRWDALITGEKLDTIRFNENTIESGFLVYESFPSRDQYCVVYVTDVRMIPLREVLTFTKDLIRKPDEATLLKRMRAHYPNIGLDSIVQYIQHLSPQETQLMYPLDVEDIQKSF